MAFCFKMEKIWEIEGFGAESTCGHAFVGSSLVFSEYNTISLKGHSLNATSKLLLTLITKDVIRLKRICHIYVLKLKLKANKDLNIKP